MSEASSGDTVKVHYTGRLSDGTVLDANHPLAGKELAFEISLVDIF
jgi:FKBP-type peptidyl-prolyl cis-trans isomerase 2